jgi:hypothetical protein
MTDHVPGQNVPASSPSRRLVAAGFTRRLAGRTLTVRVTEAGVTGRITAADRYMAAATADHLARCADCREQDADVEARHAAYGDSAARRDRIQVGLHTTAVRA